MKLNNTKGFSLMELSIVLIVVALLIAGVISGKSLIQSAKMNVIKSEMETLKIATRMYVDSYGEAITDFAAGTSAGDFKKNEIISINNMFLKGYLDGTGNSSESISEDATYKSTSEAGAKWYYAGEAAAIKFVLAGSAVDTAMIDEVVCDRFATRYTSDAMTIACTDGAAVSNGKKVLTVTFNELNAQTR